MAKSMTVGKRENEKKRLAKREAKLKRKEGRKWHSCKYPWLIFVV